MNREDHFYTLRVNGREYDAIIAGLRAIQCLMDERRASLVDFQDILTCGFASKALSPEEIDHLVEQFQFGLRA